MRWLSRDTLGAYVKSYHRISLWDRVRIKGRHAMAMANCYLDAAENVELMVCTASDTLEFWDMKNNCLTITSSRRDGQYACFILPRMEPWQVYLAVENE